MNYYIYRPEISSYQGESFRLKERKALDELGAKYVDTPIEIPDGAQAIVISTSYTKNEEILASLSHAQIALWIHPNSGYDNFSYDFVKTTPFPIVLGNEIRANAVSQFYLQSLLDHLGRIPIVKNWDKKRQYNRNLLDGKNILIIGRGPIGQKVGTCLENFDAKVNYYDPYQNTKQSKKDLTQCLEKAQVLIMACSLNKSSFHMIDEDVFKILRPEILIMNAARGKLIKQEALLEFLEKNREAHAIIDVFEKEPIDFEQFKKYSNLTMTSHIAGVYHGINNKVIKFEKEVIRSFLQDTKLDKYQHRFLSNRIKGDLLI